MNQDRKNDRLLLWITVLLWFSLYVYTPYLSPHLERLGLGVSTIGVIIGAYGFSQLLLRVPISIGDDRTGRHRLFMLLGLLAIAAGSLLPLIHENAAIYLVFRALAGVGASTWVCYTVAYASGGRERMAQIVNANNLGILLSFFAGNILYMALGIRALYGASIASAAAALVLIAFWKPRNGETQPAFHWGDFLRLLKNRPLWLYSLLMALGQLVVFATAMSFTANYAKELGAGTLALTLLSVAFYGAGMLASWLTGRKMFARWKDKTLLASGFGMMAVYCLLLPVMQSPAGVIGVQLLGGFGRTVLYTLLMDKAIQGIAPNQKTTAMGIFQSVYSLGMTMGSAVMGWLMDVLGGYGAAFIVMGVISVVGAAWCLFGCKTYERTE
ncbi:MAG: MFS transporter [Clostridiales bacterium]|nr:MFS transporter [Clostridiales bacterium]